MISNPELEVAKRRRRGLADVVPNQRSKRMPSECPCGTVMTQTRSHILADCPDHEEHRGILAAASQDLSTPILLGTFKGLSALARFIAASNAFRKV